MLKKRNWWGGKGTFERNMRMGSPFVGLRCRCRCEARPPRTLNRRKGLSYVRFHATKCTKEKKGGRTFDALWKPDLVSPLPLVGHRSFWLLLVKLIPGGPPYSHYKQWMKSSSVCFRFALFSLLGLRVCIFNLGAF